MDSFSVPLTSINLQEVLMAQFSNYAKYCYNNNNITYIQARKFFEINY